MRTLLVALLVAAPLSLASARTPRPAPDVVAAPGPDGSAEGTVRHGVARDGIEQALARLGDRVLAGPPPGEAPLLSASNGE